MKENNEIKQTSEGSINRVDKKRRSFAKTGILAPVVLTLANRPAWGAVSKCYISGFNSAEVQGKAVFSGTLVNQPVCGTNISHGYWKTHTGFGSPAAAWPMPYCPAITNTSKGYDVYVITARTPLKDWKIKKLKSKEGGRKVFFVNTAFGVTNYRNNFTMCEALESTDPWLKHMVAALLNAKRDGSSFPLGDEAQVISIFQTIESNFDYTFPGTTITWTKQNIVDFLEYIYANDQ